MSLSISITPGLASGSGVVDQFIINCTDYLCVILFGYNLVIVFGIVLLFSGKIVVLSYSLVFEKENKVV